jgi:hypothetical protein
LDDYEEEDDMADMSAHGSAFDLSKHSSVTSDGSDISSGIGHAGDGGGGSGSAGPAGDKKRHTRSSSSMSFSGAPQLDYKRHDRVAIFDATNSTNKRRQWVLQQCTDPLTRSDKPTGVVFVESVCDDAELLEVRLFIFT